MMNGTNMDQNSLSEWLDALSSINLIALICIQVFMRILTLEILQKKCPYFLMDLKAAISGVPKVSTQTKNPAKKDN